MSNQMLCIYTYNCIHSNNLIYKTNQNNLMEKKINDFYLVDADCLKQLYWTNITNTGKKMLAVTGKKIINN